MQQVKAALHHPLPPCSPRSLSSKKLHVMLGYWLAVLATGLCHGFAELPDLFLPCFPPSG